MSTVKQDVIEDCDGQAQTQFMPRPGAISATRAARIGGVITGTLIGFSDGGRTPLVLYCGQPSASAVGAGSTVDLHAAHIGRQVALMFENEDPRRPVIV